MKVTERYLLNIIVIIFAVCINAFAQLNNSELISLSENSEIILIGKVYQQASSWNEDNTRIYTRAVIQVEEYLKGSGSGNTVSVIYPGGEVGEIGEMYSHMPTFTNDEEVLVFLKKDKNTLDYKVLNGEMGKVSVILDQHSGERITTSNVRISSLKDQIRNYVND